MIDLRDKQARRAVYVAGPILVAGLILIGMPLGSLWDAAGAVLVLAAVGVANHD